MLDPSLPLLVTQAALDLGAGTVSYATSLVSEEIPLRQQVHSTIKLIKIEYSVMMGFLRDIDLEAVQKGGGKEWAEQLNEVARDVEVILDEYSYRLGSGHRRRSRDSLRNALGRTPKAGSWSDIAQRLKDIHTRLQLLSRMKTMYSINIVGGATSSQDEERTVEEGRRCNPLLSFKDLPDYLKHCFLYCSIFKEDYSISRKRLIRLWVAEGLVQGRNTSTMEEAAEDNLNQLISREMLLVTKKNVFGRVKSWHMQDMMREVALQISEQAKFCSIHDNEGETLYTKARRLSLHKKPQGIKDDEDWIGRLRSFLLFDKSFCSMPSMFSTLFSDFKLLRVLDLQDAPIHNIPEKVYHLFNLHYLSLRNTGVKGLSKSIKNLCNLETLDLLYTNVKKLPHGTTKLKKLRHLFVGKYDPALTDAYVFFKGVKAPKGLWDLKELQTIQLVEANGVLVRRVRNLVKLRKFSIIKVKTHHCAELCVSLSNMVHLHTLDIAASEDGEMLELDAMPSPPQHLQKLFLAGRLKNDVLPHSLCSLKNLKQLHLHWSILKDDQIPLLHESFPSLVSLEMHKAYKGRELFFRTGWFPKLKKLSLSRMPLELIKMEEGGLAGLEMLHLSFCQNLREVPIGIEHLTALQNLDVTEMASELVEKLRTDSHTHERVKYIPSIRHYYQANGKWIVENLKIAS